ncbi:hypothetical protein [Chachezhania sediminis]|uniref:hypothetical protein n=1 Tax=Chachezhania sediminis TaxID=2599291 RepID=UPI0018EF0509|nr:hypothetical protein [Chachezhania sediminis]
MFASLVVVVLFAGHLLIAERTGRLFNSRRARRRMGYAAGGSMIGGSAVTAVTG